MAGAAALGIFPARPAPVGHSWFPKKLRSDESRPDARGSPSGRFHVPADFRLVLLAIVFGSAAAAAARADVDILVRTDGSAVDGKVVSQDDKQIVFQPDGAKATQAVPRDSVAKVVTADDHAEY